MKRHVFVAILLGSARSPSLRRLPSRNHKRARSSIPRVSLYRLSKRPHGNHEGLRGPRSTGHVCQPRGSPAEREKPSAL